MIKIGNNLSEWSVYSCQPKTKKELEQIVEDRINKEGLNCDINDIDVSLIKDMSFLSVCKEKEGIVFLQFPPCVFLQIIAEKWWNC